MGGTQKKPGDDGSEPCEGVFDAQQFHFGCINKRANYCEKALEKQ